MTKEFVSEKYKVNSPNNEKIHIGVKNIETKEI